MTGRRFATYEEFFLFYLTQHSNAGNRALHVFGTSICIAFVVAMFVIGHPWYALLWPLTVYPFAWFGHFVLEHNKPATFGYPFWSFISDFRMFGLIVTGQFSKWLERALTANSISATPAG